MPFKRKELEIGDFDIVINTLLDYSVATLDSFKFGSFNSFVLNDIFNKLNVTKDEKSRVKFVATINRSSEFKNRFHEQYLKRLELGKTNLNANVCTNSNINEFPDNDENHIDDEFCVAKGSYEESKICKNNINVQLSPSTNIKKKVRTIEKFECKICFYLIVYL